MRLTILAIFFILSGNMFANANDCDAVLIPTKENLNINTKTFLDVLSVIANHDYQNESEKQSYSATVPIYGVPVTFGMQDDENKEFLHSTLKYFNQHYSQEQSVSRLYSNVSDSKADKWLECMKSRQFYVYFNKKETRKDRATVYVHRASSGPQTTVPLDISIVGGLIKGKSSVSTKLKFNGDFQFEVTRDSGQDLTVSARLNFSEPSTAVIPADLPPPKFPKVSIKVIDGHLQAASPDPNATVFVNQFNFDIYAPGHIKFDANQVDLTIGEYVDDKLCEKHTISSSSLGDLMSLPAHWQRDRMRLGCQIPTNNGIATKVECFVDPKYFALCPELQ